MAWSKEEKDFLIRAYTDTTFKDIALALDKKESTVRVMANRLGLTKKENIEANKKRCTKCGCVVPADMEHFPADKSKKDGLHYYCKSCHKQYRDKKKIGTKKCNKCELVKSKLDFGTRKNNKDGLDNICKECRSIKQKEYYNNGGKEKQEKRQMEHLKKYGW